jgi:hypothetical protein
MRVIRYLFIDTEAHIEVFLSKEEFDRGGDEPSVYVKDILEGKGHAVDLGTGECVSSKDGKELSRQKVSGWFN